jgi:uncharacterized repeat protein (TIGR03803 family)
VEAPNGKLYGLTTQGGTSDKGTVFEYDPVTFDYAVKYSFTGTKGATPYGSLALSYNGKLYGMTSKGGGSDLGVLFEYNFVDSVKVKFNFDGANGQNPYYTALLPICSSFTLTPQKDSAAVCEKNALELHSGGIVTGYTFKWYKNDTLIPGAIAADYKMTSTMLTDAGNYYCMVSNGCKSIKSTVCKVVIRPTGSPGCEVTGIHASESTKQLVVYPNPAKDQLTIQLTNVSESRIYIVITDILGKMVQQERVVVNTNQNQVQVNISELKQGIYLLKVMNESGESVGSEKIVKGEL